MTKTYNEDVIINDNLEVNGVSDEVQVSVKGASTQTEALQQWKNNGGTVLSEIDENGHLIVGSQDGTIDALLEAHNIEDSNKPSRGLHSKGILTGTLSNLVSWVVNELGLKGTGGLSALHRALRVQATNENTGAMASGADVRAGDFEVINDNNGATGTSNLELSALVAKLSNLSGASMGTGYGIKVEVSDSDSQNIYAIHTDNGKVYFGDVLELADNSNRAPLSITPRTTAPSSAEANDIYLHQIGAGDYVWRRYTGSVWEDVGGSQDDLSGANLTAVTVASDDKVIIQDTSDSDNIKTVTAQDIADLSSGYTTPSIITAYHFEPSGTKGGGKSSGVATRTLNTLSNPDSVSGVSLSSDQLTLPAGTYRILQMGFTFWRMQKNRGYLYNITSSSVQTDHNGNDIATLTGGGGSSPDSGAVLISPVYEFTITVSTVFELRHYSSSGNTQSGFGLNTNSGVDEVYTTLSLEKIS